MIIDVHTHFLSEEYVELASRDPDESQVRILADEQGNRYYRSTRYPLDIAVPITRELHDPEAKIRGMDALRVDVGAISPPTFMFYYWAEPKLALRFAQLQNDAVAAAVRAYPDHFLGLATLPLQAVDLAVKEMERAIDRLGLHGVEIGTSVNGRNLDEPELFPLFERAESLGVPIFVHPNACAITSGRADKYYFGNVVGFMLDTTLAIGSLIFSGILERCPRLRLCFAHGGGFLPYQAGRLDHAFAVREECRGLIPRRPSEYLGRVYFDSLTHSPKALGHLISTVGAEQVVVGTDHPFDMGEFHLTDFLRAVPGLSEEERRLLMSGNAARRFGIGKPSAPD